MKALILSEKQKLELKEIALPVAKSGEVILKISYCGICKTDAKMFYQGQRDLAMPRILGHEFCGVSDNNQHFLVWPGESCGTCENCINEKENLCEHLKIIGFHRDGGMAEYVSVPEKSLIKLDDNSPMDSAILAEPMACGINALSQFSIIPGKTILILGGGTCGLLLALTAVQLELIPYVIESNPEKIEKSNEFTNITNIKILDELPKNTLFDYAVNANADTESIEQCIASLKTGGELCVFSGLNKNDQISVKIINEIHYRQLSLKGAYGCTKQQMIQALDIIQKNNNAIRELIEDFVPLDKVLSVIPRINKGETYRYIITTSC